MSIHQNLERPHFLIKMLDAYRTTEIADMTEDRKDDEIRNFLMRRNNLLLQVCRAHALMCQSYHTFGQMREDTTTIGLCEHGRQWHYCKECPPAVEPRRTLHANHRKLVEELRVTQLGRPNPYDMCAHCSRLWHQQPVFNALTPCAALGIRGTCSRRGGAVGAAKPRAKASAQLAARENTGTNGTGGSLSLCVWSRNLSTHATHAHFTPAHMLFAPLKPLQRR